MSISGDGMIQRSSGRFDGLNRIQSGSLEASDSCLVQSTLSAPPPKSWYIIEDGHQGNEQVERSRSSVCAQRLGLQRVTYCNVPLYCNCYCCPD
ncbi:hypothetical protein CEXT_42081 [Caerostris extrusa]|uniref:Uncharacterized protein n=1 Tax=Caerostris extrusa TaxID=172846 RepID=A0AAV4QB78_CAEEX|nr:hypothetical protein CEXT_42081 [Caerostris extrusa]